MPDVNDTDTAAGDPVVAELREQISETDRGIVEAINARLELVTRLRRHKEANGLPFLDRSREQWLLDHLTEANRGPLSDEGLRELYTLILDLTKREVARAGARRR